MTTFGTANVSFGQPMSLRDYAAAHSGKAEDVAREVMARVAGVIPLLPVPLVSRAVLDGARNEADITAHIEQTLAHLPKTVRPPRRSAKSMTQDGLAILRRRNIVRGKDGVEPVEAETPVLRYYANSIAHHFSA